MTTAEYTSTVGREFNADGSVRTYPGNGIVCFVDSQRHATIYESMLWAWDKLRRLECQHKFAFVPPENFDLTIMPLLYDQQRAAEAWSSKLPLDAPLAETDAFFIEKSAEFPTPTTLRMGYSFITEPGKIQMSADFEDYETREALETFRERVSELTGVPLPPHDFYAYYIPLMYKLQELTIDDLVEYKGAFAQIDYRLSQTTPLFATDAPQLVFFDNVTKMVTADERHTLTSRQG